MLTIKILLTINALKKILYRKTAAYKPWAYTSS